MISPCKSTWGGSRGCMPNEVQNKIQTIEAQREEVEQQGNCEVPRELSSRALKWLRHTPNDFPALLQELPTCCVLLDPYGRLRKLLASSESFVPPPWWGGCGSKNIKNRNPEIQPTSPLAMGRCTRGAKAVAEVFLDRIASFSRHSGVVGFSLLLSPRALTVFFDYLLRISSSYRYL